MADITKMPNDLIYFQWGRPDNENPRLASPISASATTIVVTNAALDEDSAVITGNFIMGIKDGNGYTENVYVPSASSTDGLTFTSCIRGIDLAGLDYTTQNTSGNAVAHESGDPVKCIDSGVNFQMMISTLQGDVGTGGENWQIGNGADNDITVYAFNGDANKPFWFYDASNNGWYFSNDGVSSTAFGTGAGVTGGDGITVTAGDIDVDLTDVTTFRTTRNGNEQIGVTTEVATGLIDSTFMPSNLTAASATGTTDITGTELETLSDGSSAGTLHTHEVETATFEANIGAGDATDNDDTAITTDGTPQVIRCLITMNGTTNGGSYEMLWQAGTFKWGRPLFGAVATALDYDAIGNGGEGDIIDSNRTFVFGSGGNEATVTFSIVSVSATGFTIRRAQVKTGTGAAAQTNIAIGYQVWV